MKTLFSGLPLLILTAGYSQAELLADFDGGGVTYTEAAIEGLGASGITAGGPTGSYYSLLDNENSERNFLAFDSVGDYTGWTRITFTMDFRYDNIGADGFSIILMPVDEYGVSGTVDVTDGNGNGNQGVGERAFLPSSLGFGFRTYQGLNATVTYDDALLAGDVAYTKAPGTWGSLMVDVRRNAVTKDSVVSVTMFDGASQTGNAQNLFTDIPIRALELENFRVQLAGRTGGLAMNLHLDNLELDVAIPNPDDGDGDNLPDEWETFYGLDGNDNGLDPNNLGVAGDPSQGADGDPDLDGLTNLEEFNLGTSPVSDDTDSDGLKDNVENDTGIYLDANSTGTSPTIADSDEDGLADGVENPTLAFVDQDQPGTDPNKADTDGDGVKDLDEILLSRNPVGPDVITPSPGLVADFDGNGENYTAAAFRSGPKGFLVPGGPTGNYYRLLNNKGDTGNYISFESADDYSGWETVSFQMDLRMSNVVADGLGISFLSTDTHGPSGAIQIPNAGVEENPLINDAFGVGFIVYNKKVSTISWNGNDLAGETDFPFISDVWHSISIDLTRDPVTKDTLVNVTYFDQPGLAGNGTSVYSDFLIQGMTLEDFRVQISGRTGGSFMNLDIDNLKLSVDADGGAGLEISAIDQVVVPGMNGNPDTLSVTVTWNSDSGKNYEILASPDLAKGDLGLWETVSASTPAATGAPTTSYTESGIPLSTGKRFYVVRVAAP